MKAATTPSYTWQDLLAGYARLRDATDDDLQLMAGTKETVLRPHLEALARRGWTPADMRVFDSWPSVNGTWLVGGPLAAAAGLTDLGLWPAQVTDWLRLLFIGGNARPSDLYNDAVLHANANYQVPWSGVSYVQAYLDVAQGDHASAVAAARGGLKPQEFSQYVTAALGNVRVAALGISAGFSQGEILAHAVNKPGDLDSLQVLAGLRGCAPQR